MAIEKSSSGSDACGAHGAGQEQSEILGRGRSASLIGLGLVYPRSPSRNISLTQHAMSAITIVVPTIPPQFSLTHGRSQSGIAPHVSRPFTRRAQAPVPPGRPTILQQKSCKLCHGGCWLCGFESSTDSQHRCFEGFRGPLESHFVRWKCFRFCRQGSQWNWGTDGKINWCDPRYAVQIW